MQNPLSLFDIFKNNVTKMYKMYKIVKKCKKLEIGIIHIIHIKLDETGGLLKTKKRTNVLWSCYKNDILSKKNENDIDI